MSRGRFLYLILLAMITGGLAAFVSLEAVMHDIFTRAVVYSLPPLLLLFAMAINRLREWRRQPFPDRRRDPM